MGRGKGRVDGAQTAEREWLGTPGGRAGVDGAGSRGRRQRPLQYVWTKTWPGEDVRQMSEGFDLLCVQAI